MVPAGAGRFCHIRMNSWSFTATAQPQRTTTPKNLWCKSTSQIVRGEHEMAHLPGICTAGAVGMCGLCPLSLSSLRDAPLAQQCPGWDSPPGPALEAVQGAVAVSAHPQGSLGCLVGWLCPQAEMGCPGWVQPRAPPWGWLWAVAGARLRAKAQVWELGIDFW